MADSELSQTPVTPSIRPWFILASCFAQLLAPPAGLVVCDLVYSGNDDFPATTIAIEILKAIPYTWQLAIEPLVIAVFLAMLSYTIPNRRTALMVLLLITVLNFIVSSMLIVGRSL